MADEIADLKEQVKIEQGKLIDELIHRAGIDTKKLYELKGRVFALNSVLYYLEQDDASPDLSEEEREAFLALAETGSQAFELHIQGDDDDVDDVAESDRPAGHNQEVY